MMIDVHLTDGRTTMRFAARADLIKLISRQPDGIETDRPLPRVWIDRDQQTGFVPWRPILLRRHSISWVEQVPVEERDAFLDEHAPDVLAYFRAKEANDGSQAVGEAAAA